jgi:hypothetical protein
VGAVTAETQEDLNAQLDTLHTAAGEPIWEPVSLDDLLLSPWYDLVTPVTTRSPTRQDVLRGGRCNKLHGKHDLQSVQSMA